MVFALFEIIFVLQSYRAAPRTNSNNHNTLKLTLEKKKNVYL